MSTYPFVCHDPYDLEEVMKRDWGPEPRNYLLIDPGASFFCARFEQRSIKESLDKNIQKVNGVYVTTQRFIMINFNSKHERWNQHNTLFGRVTKVLDQNFDLIENVHIIAIEKQVTQNFKMIRLGQHILSYFIVNSKKLKNKPLILEMDNQCKTREFNYDPPKKLTKNQRKSHVKKWAEQKSYDLLKERNDINGIRAVQNAAKQNDPADTVVMGEAIAKILENYTPLLQTLVIKKNKKKRGWRR